MEKMKGGVYGVCVLERRGGGRTRKLCEEALTLRRELREAVTLKEELRRQLHLLSSKDGDEKQRGWETKSRN